MDDMEHYMTRCSELRDELTEAKAQIAELEDLKKVLTIQHSLVLQLNKDLQARIDAAVERLEHTCNRHDANQVLKILTSETRKGGE